MTMNQLKTVTREPEAQPERGTAELYESAASHAAEQTSSRRTVHWWAMAAFAVGGMLWMACL